MFDWKKYRERMDINVFKNVFRNCLEVGTEKVLIIGDYGISNKVISSVLTNSYAIAAREMGLDFSVVMQHSKARGDYADEVLISSLRKLPKRSTIVLNVSNRIGKLGSLGLSFRKFCAKNEHKFITSSSLGTLSNKYLPLITRTIDVDYKKMTRDGERIKRRLDKGSNIHISSPAGTDLNMDIQNSPGIINDGIYNQFGKGGNLPAGEVYTYPNLDKVNGTLVIDGSLRLKNKTITVNTPVKLDIKDGRINHISSNYEGRLFKETLEWAHKRSKRPQTIRRIAELGIGINPSAKIIGATIIDEKTKGTIHVANGSNNWFGGPYKSLIHLDHVIRNPLLKVDNRPLTLR